MHKTLNRESVGAQLSAVWQRVETEKQSVEKKPEYHSPFGDTQPEAVVFASNSLRKALLMYWQLVCEYDFSQWPAFAAQIPHIPEKLTTALDLFSYFETHIRNGDGELREPLLLGYLPDGTPFLLCPTDGESDKNADPVHEAHQKIADIQEYFAGRDVVFFSTDSIQKIETAADENLGKPLNSRHFKSVKEKALGLGFGKEEALDSFKEWYKKKYYSIPEDRPFQTIHTTGFVASRGEREVKREVELSLDVQNWMTDSIEIFMEMGGGGVYHQFIYLLAESDPEIWLKLGSDELRKHLENLDDEVRQRVIVFQIMGMPAMIHSVLAELSRYE